MKIAVPTAENGGLSDLVSQHFGHAPTFTVFDTETSKVEIILNQSLHRGGSGYPPDIMAPAGVEVMVCAGLGRRAIQMFEQYGIEVFVGASTNNTAKDAIQAYHNNQLQMATDETACKEHQFRQHNH